jgi:hypothetical protein
VSGADRRARDRRGDRKRSSAEDPGRGHDREGAKNYTELLAQGPVQETLEIVERHFRSIVPEHEF